jgi:hypothetical protein
MFHLILDNAVARRRRQGAWVSESHKNRFGPESNVICHSREVHVRIDRRGAAR